MKITLSKDIEAHGETFSEIELKEPSVSDVEYSGDIALLGKNETLETNFKSTVKLVSRVASIPESSVRDMAVSDVRKCWMELLPFVMPS